MDIAYAIELAQGGLSTLLTLVMGNAGFFPQVTLKGLTFSTSPKTLGLKGPKFGVNGIRELVGVNKGPICATALKPLGASSEELASIAYEMAAGGIEIIKEDDSMSTQFFAPLEDRVRKCADAIQDANAKYGTKTLYAPNLSGAIDSLSERAHKVKELGANAVMVIPGVVGYDAIRWLRDDDGLGLPIISHSAWLGGMCREPFPALSLSVAFGDLNRLAGSDMAIMPGTHGRFGLSENECRNTTTQLTCLSDLKPVLPSPGGGITPDTIKDVIPIFGESCAPLISGALFMGSDGLRASCQRFREEINRLRD